MTLIIGKQYSRKNPSKTGGVIRLFEEFKSQLDEADIKYTVIDTNWRNYKNPVFAYVSIFFAVLFKLRKHNSVSLHGTANEFAIIGPWVTLIAKLYGRKSFLRKFAGNFDSYYEKTSGFNKTLIRYALRNANIVYFETKRLVKYFKGFNQNTQYFPNVRSSVEPSSELSYKKKFIFLGQLKASKGIWEIQSAFRDLDQSFSCDFYGPIEDSSFAEEIKGNDRLRYKGMLTSDQVALTLSKYDVLLLPTFHHGEGYPGVIIESYAVGVAVIASEWGGIPEILTDGIEGLLVPVKCPSSLAAAILSLNSSAVENYKTNALKSFEAFESANVHNRVFKEMGLLDES